jgi:hypothetical protein
MANPRVDQGTLNRLLSSVTFNDAPELNVTASYLGKGMISIAFEGETTQTPGTATGVVQSPEPYQMATITIHLLRTQQLANTYKSRIESNSIVGGVDARSDSAILAPYSLVNCSISGQEYPGWDGGDPGYTVMVRGIYYINDSLFN